MGTSVNRLLQTLNLGDYANKALGGAVNKAITEPATTKKYKEVMGNQFRLDAAYAALEGLPKEDQQQALAEAYNATTALGPDATSEDMTPAYLKVLDQWLSKRKATSPATAPAANPLSTAAALATPTLSPPDLGPVFGGPKKRETVPDFSNLVGNILNGR